MDRNRVTALRLVHDEEPAPVPDAYFCGHCGEPPPAQVTVPSRVCPRCGMGLVLEARADAVPRPGEAFLVLDGSLAVCAISRKAEELLAVRETDAVHRPVSELLSPADAEGPRDLLGRVVARAARGDVRVRQVMVRPTHTFGVRYRARVLPCGPPSAALLVLGELGR